MAAFDWDSLGAFKESRAVGIAAATWRSTGEVEDPPAPGPAEIDSYIDAYERAAGGDRSRCRSRSWRPAARGAALYALAYTARCEHALEASDPALRPRRARATLETHREQFLTSVGLKRS